MGDVLNFMQHRQVGYTAVCSLLQLMAIFIVISALFTSHSVAADATPVTTKLPEMLLEAMRLAMKTHPEVLRAESEMQSAKSQVKAGE